MPYIPFLFLSEYQFILCTGWHTAIMDLVIPVSAPLSTLEDHYNNPENQHKADKEERIIVCVESQDEIK